MKLTRKLVLARAKASDLESVKKLNCWCVFCGSPDENMIIIQCFEYVQDYNASYLLNNYILFIMYSCFRGCNLTDVSLQSFFCVMIKMHISLSIISSIIINILIFFVNI